MKVFDKKISFDIEFTGQHDLKIKIKHFQIVLVYEVKSCGSLQSIE